MNTWDEVEKQPEFGLLTPEDKETVHNEWQQGVLKTLTDEDPEKINSAGVHNFLATEQARRNSFKTGGLFDATQAQQGYAQSLKERSDAQSKALADYDAVEKNRFALKDAESARNAAMAMDTYVGEGAKTLDQNIALRKQELAAAENQLTPEQLKQAAEAKEAMEGKRPTAVLGSDLYTSPALLLDKDKYRQAVAQSDASPDAKARALADFTAKRSQYAKNALNTFRTAGESPIPGTTSFASWEAAQPEEVRKLSPEDKALEYMRTMEKRGEFSKLTSAIGIGALQGSTDIATQGLGVAAMATGSPKLAQKAAEVSEGANTLEEQAKLEGERASLAGRTAAGVTRQAIPMAAQVTGAALTGGASMPVAAGIAGLQTAGAQFPETYAELRKQGFSEEDAMRASRNAAALSGAITAGITAAFGKTGVESALRTGAGGKELVKNRLVAALKAIPKGAVSEIPEELLDEMATQVVEQRTIDPSKPVAQIVDDFAKTAPELALQVGLLGATGEGIGRFRKTTTKPGETAPAAPDTDFARRAALEGATEYNGPGEPVTVQGRVIAHVMPGAGLTPDQVAEYADEPDTLKALARANRIRLPEVVPPIEGVDTTEMDENIAASASLAPGTVDALRNLPPVTTGTETPVNAANVDGGSQSVQTEPAEGSIPAVTETKLPEPETESSLENQPTAPNAPNPIEQQEGVRGEPAQGTPGEQTEEAGAGDSLRRAEEEQEVGVPESGKYSVYQSGDRWLIQQSDKRGFGDQIVASQEEAIKESLRQQDMDRRNKEFWEKQKEKDEAVRAEQEAKDKPLNEYLGDTGLTAMQRGRLKKSLQESAVRKSEEKGKIYSGSRESVVREMVADGYSPKTEEVPTIKEPTGSQWNRMDNRQQAEFEKKRKAAGNKTEYRLETENGGRFVITKAEHEYAKWLVEKAGLGGRPESKKPTLSERAVKARIEDLDPVPADAVDAYDLELPEGYVRQGDLYVYSPQQQTAPQQTAEWSPQTGQEASFVLNGKSIIGTIESVRPDGNAVVRYSWDGKTEKTAVVPAAQLKRPIAALATAPWYEYNQEQNTRKAAKHGIPSKPGIYNNFNLQKVFDSMANDKSLSHIYRMIARVLASKSSLSSIKVGIWEDGRRNFAGLYSNAGGTDPRIDLNLRHVGRGRVDILGTLLHEALHHETMEKLRNPQTEVEREAAEAINTLRKKIAEYAKNQGKYEKFDYELKSQDEFVSALFTRPDFQDFLATIPADFVPRTAASKFRSVLSELFRLIAQVNTNLRVPKGSPMEQAMTATLALFETPYRPVVTESVNLPASLPESRKSLRVKVTREALTNDALSQASWKDWYQEHQDTLQRFFQEDAELFQKILAITSQAASVKANVGLALKAFTQLKEGKPFEGFLPAVAGNLNKLVSETEIGGQKIGAYISANEGDTESVVVDRHIARMLFGVDTPSKAQFAKASKVLTEIANEIGWTPRQVQAALWAASIVKSGKTPQSYGSYIQQLHAKGTLRERIGRVVSERSEVHGPSGTREADFGRSEEQAERLTGTTPPSKVAYSPAERGYRTPSDELTETAAKLRGEQTGAAPTGLQKMFNPQPGRPATGERRLFEMPKEQPRQVDLRTAYQRAQSGSGTGWVSIKDVYGQAKEADPDLTPEEFMAHINEQNDSGKIYVSPLETAAAVEAAKPFVVGAANAEMLMPQQVAMSPAESVPSEDLFRETRSRFAPTKPEDRMYRVQGDEEANRKVSDWINSVTPARAASLLLSNRTPGWMDGNMRTIALGNLIKGFTEIVSTSADEDEQTVARATAQDLGKLWVKEGQDPARSMRQRGVQNGTTLQPIAPILAAQQVLADRGEKVLKDQIVGGSEEAVPRIEAARERADEELENRLQKIVTRIMGGMQTIGTAKGAIARMFRGKGQRDQIVDEVGKALMLKARGNVVTPERRTALANLVSSLKSTLAKNVQGERIPAPKQTTQDLLTSAFVNQVAEGPLFEEAWAEGRQKVLDMLVDIEMDKKVAPAEKRVTDLTERLRHLEAGSDEQRKAAATEIANLGRQIESELDLIRSEREAIKALMPQLEAQRDKLMPATPSMAFNPAASREAISRAFEQAGYTADVTTGLDKSGKRTLSVKDALLNRQRAVDAVMRVFDEAMQQADENTQREWPAARAAAVKAVNETLDTWQKQMDEDAAEKLAEKKESLLGEDSRALQKLVNSIRAKIAPGQDWSDVLSDLPQKQKDRLAEIKERVAKHEALQNLTADEADQLVKNIDKLWQKERLKAFQDELLRAGVIKAKTAKAEANVVSAAPELLRLMNLGVFSSSTFREAVSKRFGLKQMTNAQADYLKKLAVEAWNLPEGVLRNNKLKEVVDGLQHTTKATFSEIMSSYWVASVLSGLRTQFETWATLIVGAGANLIQAAGLLATGKGGAALQAHFQWWNALGGVMKNEVAYLLRTGDSSITKKYAEDIAKSLSGEKGSVLNALGERWWKEGNIAQKVPGLLMIAVGRSMMAADHVNNTATTQGAMAVARAMNPELYNGKSGYTQKEHEGARALALAQVTGGAEPANAKERALVSARTREILNENVQEEDRSEASEIGNISAFQNDPTGLFGMLYQMAKSMTSTGQRWFEKRAEDENSFALARAINAVGAGVIHAATGTRFMRFGFNMGNEYIRYMPGSWVLDKWIYPILEDTKTPMRSQLLIGKNLIGAMLFATVQAWLGDDDDEKDGVWHIEGDWADLSDANKESRMSAGFRPRSFWIRENGKMKTIFYTQWPLAGLMAAVGATHDERRYKPEKWKERGTFGHILHAAQVGLFQAQNSAALQRLAELFGKTDPNISDKKLNLPEKMAVNVVSGVTPTFIKDLDKWNDPRSYSPEGMWESMVREVPVARRYVNDGRPQFNRLGEDIKLHREPYSRLVLNQELSKPMEIYGKLLSRGLDFSSPSTDRKIVKDGKAVPMESFGRGVVYDFEKGVAQARREMLEKHGDKLTTMPISSAHKLLKDISRMIVDREAAKVQSAINKQSRK